MSRLLPVFGDQLSPGLASLVGALAFDIRAAARREAPAWYPRLRLLLTIAVCPALIAAALLTTAHG